MTLAVDGDEDFVEEPRIAWPSLAAAQGSSVGAPELETPLPDRLVTDDDATFGEEILGIPEAEAEPMVEPDGVSDDLARVAIASVRIGRLHLQIIFAGSAPRQLDNAMRRHTATLASCSDHWAISTERFESFRRLFGWTPTMPKLTTTWATLSRR